MSNSKYCEEHKHENLFTFPGLITTSMSYALQFKFTIFRQSLIRLFGSRSGGEGLPHVKMPSKDCKMCGLDEGVGKHNKYILQESTFSSPQLSLPPHRNPRRFAE